MALALFDRNHDGKLDAEERNTLLQFVQRMMPQITVTTGCSGRRVRSNPEASRTTQRARGDQNLALGAVGDNPPVIDQNHAIDLRDQVGKTVRHHRQTNAGLRKF